jgi:hypothetical protein
MPLRSSRVQKPSLRYPIWLLGSVNIPCARARWKTRIIVGRSVREHRRVYPVSVHVNTLDARAIDRLGTSSGPYHSPSYPAIAHSISCPLSQSRAFLAGGHRDIEIPHVYLGTVITRYHPCQCISIDRYRLCRYPPHDGPPECSRTAKAIWSTPTCSVDPGTSAYSCRPGKEP